MKVSAIVLARLVAFLQAEDLDPKSKVSPLALATKFAERYEFRKSPQKLEDYDLQKGAEFAAGKFNQTNIDRFVLFANAILVDTRSSTDDSETVLQDALQWVGSLVGLDSPPRITRKSFLSQLTFHSDVNLFALNPKLQRLAEQTTKSVSKNIGQPMIYEPTIFAFAIDPLTTSLTPSPLTIERRQGVPFSEHKYFSSAPLPTDEHLSLLVEFEAALKSQS